MMTERERLIQLIRQAEENFFDAGKPILDIEEYVADYLLDNGIVSLPVRVGDIVYTNRSMQGWYMKLKDRPYEAKVAYIGVNGKDNFMNVTFLKNDNMLSFKFSEIGKTIFLTREEAEKALKEQKK